MDYLTLYADTVSPWGDMQSYHVTSQPAWAAADYLDASTRAYWRKYVLQELVCTSRATGWRVSFRWESQ